MAVFTTEDAKVLLPHDVADGMIAEARSTSTVAQLSAREPQRFGNTDIIVFNDFPKAEFVDEGAQKGATKGGFSMVTAKPRKAQVTMRFNEEVQWADEDHQKGILRELAGAGQVALSRALDLGLYHRINPLTGTEITGWDNYLTATTNVVETDAGDADAQLRAAVGLLMQADTSWGVNGQAFDPRMAWALSELTTKDGTQRYPSLGYGANIAGFNGIPAAQGNTVSGTPEATDTGVRAIVGDFANGIRWGIQRDLPVEFIRFGDPDGQGDLKRHNQIALRLEIVFGWYVFADRFAVVKAAAEDAEGN